MPHIPSDPPLSPAAAHSITLLFASFYVGSIYISKNTRISYGIRGFSTEAATQSTVDSGNTRTRDHPEVIRARIVAVSIATILCCFLIFTIFYDGVQPNRLHFSLALGATIKYLGLGPQTTIQSLLPHLVTPLLYLGPLYACCLGGYLPMQKHWSFEVDVKAKLLTWQGARNYIAGPITEELVFRACVLAVYHISGLSRTKMIFLAPLSFGLAHVHHAWETWHSYGGTASAAKRAILISLFQFAYTTLFGFHCSYLFLRTGSIYPPITAHMFCNFMGLPALTWEIRAYPKYKNRIFLAYLLGIIGYVYTMGAWTKVDDSLFWLN